MEDDDASQQDADEVIRLSQQPPVVGLLMAQAKATLPPVSLIAGPEKEWLRAALTRQRKMIRTIFHCRARLRPRADSTGRTGCTARSAASLCAALPALPALSRSEE